MNVVHVLMPDSVYDPDRVSGGNVYDRRLCAELRAAGWRVDEVLLGWPPQVSGLTDALAEMPDRAVVLVDGLIATHDPEVFLAAAGRLRLVLLMHMAGASERSGPDPTIGRLAAAAAAVLTTSSWTARRLASWYPALGQPTAALPGADRGMPARGGDGSALLCVAAVTPHKGQDLLVAALSRLSGLTWQCTVVGPLDRDPGFVADVASAVKAYGLTDRIHLVGAQDGHELADSYAAADLLVHPSVAESYGMVIVEALAHGLPVICAEVGGVPEALGRATDGSRPGLLVPPGDPAALAEAIGSWLTDPRLRHRCALAAADRRDHLPDWSTTATTVAQVLGRVAA